MCRHLAHLGPPATLAALLLDPPHGLLHQSYAPADMRGGGTVNADGFGVGWYPPAAAPTATEVTAAEPVPGVAPCGDPAADRPPAAAEPPPRRSAGATVGEQAPVAACGDPAADRPPAVAEPPPRRPAAATVGEQAPVAACGDRAAAPFPVAAGEATGRPARYRTDRPIWADTGFAGLAAVTSATAVLAAVRSATPGLPVTAAAAAPFGEACWLFSHNGLIRGWPDTVAGLAGELPVTDLLTLDAPTDSALLWALVRHRLRTGGDPAAVLAGVVHSVAAAAPGSRLNLLLTDGSTIWATTWTHALSVRVGADAATVASEPSDAGADWVPVPDRHLVVASRQGCDVRPLNAVALEAATPTAAASAAGTSAAETSASETSTAAAPVAETSAAGTSAAETAVAETSACETSTAAASVAETSAAETPAAGMPAA